MSFQLHNTATRTKEEFVPLERGVVRMYVCGPNLYGPAHVGHGFSYAFFDVLRRYLEYRGLRVLHVQNFTDIEDRIIERATGECVPRERGCLLPRVVVSPLPAAVGPIARRNAGRGADRPRSAERTSHGLRPLEGRQGGRAVLAQSLGAGAPRMAHRVFGDDSAVLGG